MYNILDQSIPFYLELFIVDIRVNMVILSHMTNAMTYCHILMHDTKPYMYIWYIISPMEIYASLLKTNIYP